VKIKAMYLEKPGKIVEKLVEKPKAGEGEVLVRIRSVGICGSDVHFYEEGRIGNFVVRKPLILGHECSGEVTEIGKGVNNLKVGDRVALEPGVPCRICEYCKGGRYNLCPSVKFMAAPPIDGAFVEYIAHPADFAFKIPQQISFDEAALFEPLAVGLYAVERAKIKPTDRVLILGAGPIGLVTLQAVLCIKGVEVTVLDLYEFRLARARELGADELINPEKVDILEKFGPEFSVVFETAGSTVTTQQTVKLARQGGRVVLVGLPGQDEINLDTKQIIFKELDVLGLHRYANMYPRAVKLTEEGSVNLRTLVTQRFPFEETERALQFARDNKDSSIKVVVEI